MKILITASRKLDAHHYAALAAVMEAHYPNATEIVHGGARGGDQLAKRYAREKGLKETELRPDYDSHHPKAAPLMRNTELVKLATATLAIYCDARSGGTLDTATKTLAAGKKLIELNALTGETTTLLPAPTLF